MGGAPKVNTKIEPQKKLEKKGLIASAVDLIRIKKNVWNSGNDIIVLTDYWARIEEIKNKY